MDEFFVTYIIDCAINGLKNEHKIWEGIYYLAGDFDSEYLNEIENNFIDIAWQTIIKARDIEEINRSEFECFAEIMYDIMREDNSSFEWEGIKYTFKNSKDIWNYFNGSHIKDFNE